MMVMSQLCAFECVRFSMTHGNMDEPGDKVMLCVCVCMCT